MRNRARTTPTQRQTRSAQSARAAECSSFIRIRRPRSELEKMLCSIWADVLGAEHIGVEDNFFARGGHSLLASQLLLRVRQALQIDIPLALLFEHPVLRAFAKHVGKLVNEQAPRELNWRSLSNTRRSSSVPPRFIAWCGIISASWKCSSNRFAPERGNLTCLSSPDPEVRHAYSEQCRVGRRSGARAATRRRPSPILTLVARSGALGVSGNPDGVPVSHGAPHTEHMVAAAHAAAGGLSVGHLLCAGCGRVHQVRRAQRREKVARSTGGLQVSVARSRRRAGRRGKWLDRAK